MAAVLLAWPVGALCPTKTDPHGTWSGNLLTGGNYTLTCAEGYSIVVGVNHSDQRLPQKTIACPESGVWEEDPVCINDDDCASLKHGCGLKGICIDRVQGYTCDCEEGIAPVEASDGSGEWLCGGLPTAGACAGSTCGAHGVCIDLAGTSDAYDSGNTSFRCSCSDGYEDNNFTCVPKDCGERHELYGLWQGQTTYGGEYTVTCGTGSFVLQGMLKSQSLSCPTDGAWPSTGPLCINAWMESVDAGVGRFRFWFAAVSATVCVLLAALAAGLTMGLVSLSDFDMRLLLVTRTDDCSTQEQLLQLEMEQEAASRVSPLLKDHHRLLVTLLLLNSVANEALPIFLDQILPSYMAVLVSVTCVLFFGEILPSAVFTGPQQLPLAAAMAPVVRCLQLLFMPAALPIKMMLDNMVGHGEEGPKYNRAELKALIRLHRCDIVAASNHHGGSAHQDSDPSDVSEISEYSESGDEAGSKVLVSSVRNMVTAGCDEENPQKQDSEALTHLECSLAQRSLDLSRVQLRSLSLNSVPTATASEAPTLRVSEMSTVAEALQLLSNGPPGQLCTIVSQAAGVVICTVSREALLWAALVPQEFED